MKLLLFSLPIFYVFSVVSFGSLIGLGKPVVSVFPRNPFLMAYAVACFAISPLCSRVFWEKMPSRTMRLLGILRCYTLSSKYILFFSHKLQMRGITAGGVATKMIYLSDPASWDWLYKHRVDYPMYSLGSTLKPQKPIPTFIFGANPIPTSRFLVYRHPLKYSLTFFYTKFIIYKVHGIIIPHGRLM